MRSGVALALVLISPLASADVDAGDVGDAWRDFAAQDQVIENASTQDCGTACKALESLARAAQHICDVAPDKCDEAKARLRAASDRVHAACPQCNAASPPNNPPNNPPTVNVAQESATQGSQSRGGCAGCTMTSDAPDAGIALLGLGALAMILRLRKRVRH